MRAGAPADPLGFVAPMLASAGPAPDGEGWQVELKWDGVRAVVAVHRGDSTLWTRNGRERSVAWPELAGLATELGITDGVLDGEIVTLDDEGRPSFELLQRRMHVTDPGEAARLAEALPATFVVFDLLRLDGDDVTALPLVERRARLDALAVAGPSWVTSPSFGDDPGVVLDVARTRGLEGVVVKRLDSPYRPGRRSREWIKTKLLQRDDFAVGGWFPGRGRRQDALGALALGVADDGGLRFVGRVGTGFSDAELDRLRRRLDRLATHRSPFVAGPAPGPGLHPVHPALIVEVAYGQWTAGNVLRHPSYVGMRTDLMPGDAADVDATGE